MKKYYSFFEFFSIICLIFAIIGGYSIFSKLTSNKDNSSSPNVEVLTKHNDDLCDYFAIDNTGNAVQSYGYSATSFIDITNAVCLNISMMQTKVQINYGLAFYDEDKTFISFVNSLVGNSTAKQNCEINIPENAKYFRTSFFDYNLRKTYGDFCYKVQYRDGYSALDYRPYQDGNIYFSCEVNQSLNQNDKTNIKVTTGVLALPKSYTATGKKTKMIMYFHGYSHYVYYDSWGATTSFAEQKQHFLNLGYAVMDCNGARDNNMQGYFTSAGSPQYVDGYRQCYEYIVNNYNIDSEIYVVGGSAGGPASINYCYTYNNVKALILLSAWTNLYEDSWGQGVRDTFVEFLGFNSTTNYEINKTIGYDPALHIKTDKDTLIEYIDDLTLPVCAFVGSLEKEHVLYKNLYRFINALKQCNTSADIIEWDNKGHEIVSGADTEIDNAIIDYFNSI